MSGRSCSSVASDPAKMPRRWSRAASVAPERSISYLLDLRLRPPRGRGRPRRCARRTSSSTGPRPSVRRPCDAHPRHVAPAASGRAPGVEGHAARADAGRQSHAQQQRRRPCTAARHRTRVAERDPCRRAGPRACGPGAACSPPRRSRRPVCGSSRRCPSRWRGVAAPDRERHPRPARGAAAGQRRIPWIARDAPAARPGRRWSRRTPAWPSARGRSRRHSGHDR